MLKHKKHIWIALGFLLLVVVTGYIIYVNKRQEPVQGEIQEENEEIEWGPFRNGEEGALYEKLIETIYVDDKYPWYYGGAYVEKQNLVILLTVKSKIIERQIIKILGQEEGIVIRYAEYSLNDLREVQKEIGDKYLLLQKEGNEETVQLISDITNIGIRQMKNTLIIGVKNISDEKVRELEKIFGHTDMIRYEGTGGNVLTDN